MKKISRGLALDIDETLSITGIQIVEKLQERYGNPENLSKYEIMEKYKHTSNVPYWKSVEIREWHHSYIQSDELYENVNLIENSNHIVQKVDTIIPISCYLTARPENTIETTRQWLKKHNFPEREIICRPMHIAYEDGNKWKAAELLKFYPDILGIVDDNPGLIDALPPEYKGTIFLYSHLQYDITTPINVIPCIDWEAVYDKIQKEAHVFLRS